MGTTSSIFTGSSQFSSDFQSVVTRAVNIASLPVTLLQNQLSSLQNQSSALGGLDSKFGSLQTALNSVQDALGGASFLATASDTKLISPTLTNGAVEGTYKIEVVKAGSASTSMTTASWVTDSGAAKTYKLWVGAKTDPKNGIDITPADNTAQSVAAAINAAAGDKVRAIAMNTSSSTSPDWRISLQSVSLGDIPVDIEENGTGLQTQTAGEPAQYRVGGSTNLISSSSATVTIATGVTVKLLAADEGNPVTLTVSRTTTALTSALSKFSDAYNAVVAELDKQRGSSAGALGGDSVIYSLTQALSSMATYSPAGSKISGLRDLGLELGSDGKFTFDSSKLIDLDTANPVGVEAFFGLKTGGGFLKLATDALASVEDKDTGILKTTKASMDAQITALNTRISDKQSEIDDLQKTLLTQMAAADSAIAAMEQQYSYLTGMFQAQRIADEQYK